MDIAELLAKDYYKDDTIDNITEIRRMLGFPGVHVYFSPDHLIWVYMLLSDEGMAILKSTTQLSDFTANFTNELLAHPGEYIYIFRNLSLDKENHRANLRKAANFLMKKHNSPSISWHDDKRVFLHTFGGS